MNPIVKHAVNEILKMSPDFPVENYTWIVDPNGFIPGTSDAMAALWPEFGSLVLKNTNVNESSLVPSFSTEWLSVAANSDDTEFGKLPVLSPTLAIVLQPKRRYGCVLFVNLLSFVVFRMGFCPGIEDGDHWEEINAVAFDNSGAAVVAVNMMWRPKYRMWPVWDRDWIIANGDKEYSDYELSTATLAVKRAIDLSRTSTVAYVPTRQRHASRRAAGRKPAFEWRTVVIEPVRPKAEHKGGTHASPRRHDRRGHWSHSKLGKKFWVPPCKVGKASNGTVFHDYVVK